MEGGDSSQPGVTIDLKASSDLHTEIRSASGSGRIEDSIDDGTVDEEHRCHAPLCAVQEDAHATSGSMLAATIGIENQAPCKTSADPAGLVEYDALKPLLVPLFLPGVLSHTTRSLILAVLPLQVLDMGYAYDDVGYMMGFTGLGTMLSNIPAGAFVVEYGPRALICVSFSTYFVAVLLLTVAEQKVAFCFACFAIGCAESFGILARQTFLGACIKSSIRGRVSSTLGGTARVGYTVGPLLGGIIAHRSGPRAVYLLQGGVAITSIVILMIFMPYVPANQDIASKSKAPSSPSTPPSSTLMILRSYWRVLLSVTGFTLCISILRKARELLFPIEGHARDLSQESIGYIISASYACDALLFPVAGYLLDSIGRTRTGALTSISFALAVSVLECRSHVCFVAFAFLSGIANGLGSGIILTLGADLAPSECRGQFLALYRTLGRLADLVAPLLVGTMAEQVSLSMAEFMVACVGVFGAIWVLRCVRETLPTKAERSSAATNVTARVLPQRFGKYAEVFDPDDVNVKPSEVQQATTV